MKHATDGSIEKYKAIFVAKSFSQVEGVNYEEIFSPVEKYYLIITILELATQMGWKINQMNVKTIFLNGLIEEEICIEQPEGFETYEWEMCVESNEPCMVPIKHPKHGTLRPIHISVDWDSPKVKRCQPISHCGIWKVPYLGIVC